MHKTQFLKDILTVTKRARDEMTDEQYLEMSESIIHLMKAANCLVPPSHARDEMEKATAEFERLFNESRKLSQN